MTPSNQASVGLILLFPALNKAFWIQLTCTIRVRANELQRKFTCLLWAVDPGPYWPWISHVGSSDPTLHFSCVPALRKQLLLANTAYFCERYAALMFDRWTGICCTEGILVNDTTVVLTCAVANRGIQLNVDVRLADPEWMCGVGLMGRMS